MTPLLEVKNLQTYFFTRWGLTKAVDGISFSLDKEETLGLVGESGCGKTMTGLSIMRLVPQPAGRIVGGQVLFKGDDLLRKSDKEMQHIRGDHISVIFQDPTTSLNPVLTIGDQVGEPIHIHHKLGRRALLERVKEMLSVVDIPNPETRILSYPHQFSGGMRQRIVGAISLISEPDLVIADEPTTSLDVTIQAQFLRLLKQLQARHGLAILFITHDFGIVAKVCDKVAVMYAGRLVEVAEVRELFNHPAHPYTMALLRSVPKLEERMERLQQIEGQPPVLRALPPGCYFANRCSYTIDRCQAEYPPDVEISKDHIAACWRLVKP